jgi:hypothetical protein
MLSLWGDLEQPIALVELAAIVLGVYQVLAVRPQWHGRDVVWFEDNAVVLSAMVRGNSKSASIDVATMGLHIALAMLGCRSWCEYIESEANWMDEASRSIDGGVWAARNGFIMAPLEVPMWPWLQSIDGMVGKVKAQIFP